MAALRWRYSVEKRERERKERKIEPFFHNQWQVGNFSLKSQEKQGVKVLLDLY
jgi:hypothetical protein